MPIAQLDLQKCLQQAFPQAQITTEDLAGDNDHWQVTIVAKEFTGQSKLAQHRLVHNALTAYNIHALSIKTLIPQE